LVFGDALRLRRRDERLHLPLGHLGPVKGSHLVQVLNCTQIHLAQIRSLETRACYVRAI